MANTGCVVLDLGDWGGLVPREVSVLLKDVPRESITVIEELCGDAGDPSKAAIAFPLVGVGVDGKLLLVDGYKRLACYESRHARHCPCLVIQERLSPAQAGVLRLVLNLERELAWAEKIAFIAWLDRFTEAPSTALLLNSMRLTERDAQILRRIAAAPEVARALADGIIDLNRAHDLLELAEPARNSLLSLFKKLQMSAQTQREFVEWLPELESAAGIPVEEVLGGIEVRGILDDLSVSAPRRIERLRELLHAKRFPRYHAALRSWKALVAKVNPDPSSVNFIAPPFFERDRVDVRVTVTDPLGAARLFGELARIPGDAWRLIARPFV